MRVRWSAWMFVAGLALGCAIAELPAEGDVPGRDDGGDAADPEGERDVDGDVDADTWGDPGDARDGADPGEADVDVPPGTCTGAVVGGACWFLGAEERSCDDACAGHGTYDEATLNFAGSAGTNVNCDMVLAAFGLGGGPTTTLTASGEGVGCVYMAMTDRRYRVADMPTVSDALYMLSQRACACTP